jgi:carboxypeptidase family protein
MTIAKSFCSLLLSAGVAICADSGSIGGKVLSAAGAGAPVPKALVQATNSDTKASFKATSDGEGKYEIGGLPTGTYELSIDGMFPFLPFHEGGVKVAAGRATKADIRLDDVNLNTLGDGGEQFAQALADRPLVSGPTPRVSDGKPDLTGVWQPTAPKLVPDSLEPLPEAEAVSRQRGKRGLRTDLQTTACLPGGIGLAFFFDYRIIQTPSLIVIIDGGFSPPRQIYLDGRGHPPDFNPSWMGHSVGHWDRDTLVVDTVGFNDLGWIGGGSARWPAGFPTTDKLRVTERFRRLDLGRLEVETTYEDPSEFKKPFTMREVRLLAPKGEEVLEYVCAENERDVSHMHFEK